MHKKQQKLLDEALAILQALDFPRAQQNERSALTFLALLNLTTPKTWKDAESPMVGIRSILDFCRSNFGKPYAENTRETFRRQTMHQFVAAGLVVENADEPQRPTNSPKWCYQIEPGALQLLRDHYKTKTWKNELAKYLSTREGLASKYAMEREIHMVPVVMTKSTSIQLSPGRHSQLIKENPKRRDELAKLFATCTAGSVYVSAFSTRANFSRYQIEISWETEVWVAEAPSHLIHFNGEKFLGPYDLKMKGTL